MSRPTTHGGGEAAPPIAGDPASFPSDAELARTLVAHRRTATLSTLTDAGFPYGSVVSYAADDVGAPVLLISDMAEHTVNARADDRVSMLVAEQGDDGDPLGRARLTLVGRMRVLNEPGELRDRYLAMHPYAAYYADFTDFAFWRMTVDECRYVGGFGHMSWVTADEYRTAHVDPVATGAPAAVAHMNEDHADSLLLLARALGRLEDATDALMIGLDRYGCTLRVQTSSGPRMARIPFPRSLDDAGHIRSAVVDLVATARAADGP